MSEFHDKVSKCPRCGRGFGGFRRTSSIGRVVQTWCTYCRKFYRILVDPPAAERQGEGG